MRWGLTVLTVVLLIALVWVSGCSTVSLGNAQVGDFGKSMDSLKAMDWFEKQYGKPEDYKEGPRFLEPMVSSGVADKMPTDKILKFSDKTPSVYFWVIYEGFNKGDPVTATWTFQGKQFATLSKPVGGNYGPISAQFDKPASGWALGTHTITITGGGATNSVTFDIIAGDTVTAPLPFEETGPPIGEGPRGEPRELGKQGAAGGGAPVSDKPAQTGAVVPAGGVKPGSDLVQQGVVGAVTPVSDDKPVRDLPKQGVVGAQGPVSGKSAQTGLSFCGADQLMKNSVCVCKDPSLQACGADCVNQLVDPSNCGACGKTCGAGQTCESGICKCSKSGLEICPNGCFDLKNDLNNCGTCGTVCPQKLGAAKCSSGSCGCVNPSLAMCSGEGCVNLQSDNDNCGDCGHVCPDHMICSGTGKCRCDKNNNWVNYNRKLNEDYGDYSDEGSSSNPCRNIKNDPNNCGYPTHKCPANAPKCNGGYCIT